MKKWIIVIVPFLMFILGSACALTFEIAQPITQALSSDSSKDQPIGAIPIRLSPTQAPADIVQLADAATMTDKGRAIFFATQPVIDSDRNLFEQHCSTQTISNGIELGCYTSDNRIYLLNISDPRLSGEMVVVAAHEMLHAAYAQLSSSEKDSLNSKLEVQLAKIHNADLTQRLNVYRVLEPGQRDEELHSILGTEFAPLSNGLEQYYSQYFTIRSRIVADSQKFDSMFTQLQGSLESLQTQIIQTRSRMRSDLAKHKISAYNALVPKINSLISQYNRAVRSYNALSRSLVGEESPVASQ
jgi:hypothetical protein